tara:strand:- start:734 stop:883 length:150 start_codon:yes stop_codon:yes gene_type:complete
MTTAKTTTGTTKVLKVDLIYIMFSKVKLVKTIKINNGLSEAQSVKGQGP